jgi:hypothetical protein
LLEKDIAEYEAYSLEKSRKVEYLKPAKQSFNEFIKHRYYTSKIEESAFLDSDNTLYIADISFLDLSEAKLDLAEGDFSNIIAINTDFTNCHLHNTKFHQSIMLFAKGVDTNAVEMQTAYHATAEESATLTWAEFFLQKLNLLSSSEEVIARVSESLAEDGDYIEIEKVELFNFKCSNPILAATIRDYNSIPTLKLPISKAEAYKSKQKPLIQKLAEFSATLSEKSWKIYDVPTDGNCFFYAVAHQLKLINHDLADEKMSHSKLREYTASYLSEHLEIFKDFIEGEPATYISQVNTNYFWADYIAITALAMHLDIKIHVEEYEKEPKIINESGKQTIYLGNFSDLHFVSLTNLEDKSISDHPVLSDPYIFNELPFEELKIDHD